MSRQEFPVNGRASGGSLAGISEQFPGWHAWQSDAGRFWAARTGTLPRHPPGGFAMTVDGDTPDQLRQAIAEQEERAVPG